MLEMIIVSSIFSGCTFNKNSPSELLMVPMGLLNIETDAYFTGLPFLSSTSLPDKKKYLTGIVSFFTFLSVE